MQIEHVIDLLPEGSDERYTKEEIRVAAAAHAGNVFFLFFFVIFRFIFKNDMQSEPQCGHIKLKSLLAFFNLKKIKLPLFIYRTITK